jgi:hypothetical protein
MRSSLLQLGCCGSSMQSRPAATIALPGSVDSVPVQTCHPDAACLIPVHGPMQRDRLLAAEAHCCLVRARGRRTSHLAPTHPPWSSAGAPSTARARAVPRSVRGRSRHLPRACRCASPRASPTRAPRPSCACSTSPSSSPRSPAWRSSANLRRCPATAALRSWSCRWRSTCGGRAARSSGNRRRLRVRALPARRSAVYRAAV